MRQVDRSMELCSVQCADVARCVGPPCPALAQRPRPSPPHVRLRYVCAPPSQIKEAGTVVHRYRCLCSPARSTKVISQKSARNKEVRTNHIGSVGITAIFRRQNNTIRRQNNIFIWKRRFLSMLQQENLRTAARARRQKPGPAWLVRFCWSCIRLQPAVDLVLPSAEEPCPRRRPPW